VVPIPEPEDQVPFLFKVQSLLSGGSFVATDKYALLLSLADLAAHSARYDRVPNGRETS
jgi:hypothetical protein